MLDKIMQAQQKAAEIKQKLSTVIVTAEAGNKKVEITLDANKNFKDIQIAPELLTTERKEELQDLIGIAFEKALAHADEAAQRETMTLMSNMMPGLGSLFGK